MWGINLVVVGQILGRVVLKDILSGNHGAPKIIRDKIIVCVANNDLAMAKIMVRSVAQQDKTLYNDLKRELRDKLSEEEWQQIFSG
ncbi:hypothetical protein FB106_11410 [Synechococcus sp. Ace-Pa]|nr:hypothetical protein BM449_00170 [Synechococcus sp. SynAce01]TWB89002.1 hypothetical protein FB106_11410 [Synechococcus sp. Ace-Pa]